MTLGIIILIVVVIVIIFLSTGFYIMLFKGGPFIPTPLEAVHEVLKHAKIKKGDKVYDIGAGDGRFVHFAVKDYKANAVGFELDPFVFTLAKLKQWIFGWKGKMIRGNFLNQKISDADVIICYMLPKSLARYQEKFEKELKKGTKIVSYAFHIGSLKPSKVIPKKEGISKIWIYKI